MDGFSGREILEGELVLEPEGSDRTIAQDGDLATGQASKAISDERRLDHRSRGLSDERRFDHRL